MLTTTQLQAIKAAIEADATLNAIPNTPDGAFEIAKALNLTASPAFVLWRSNVATTDIRSVLVWAEYDGLSVSKQNAFSFLCANGFVDARLTNVRQGIQSIFSGGTQSGNLAALVAIAKRDATRAEKAIATGTGTSGTPATSPFSDGWQITYQEVLEARAL